MEKTFFMIKPDGVARGLVGQVLERIERRGFSIERLEMRQLDKSTLDKHYEDLVGKDFYPAISDFMLSGPVVLGVISGPSVVSSWRQMMGATQPLEALPGTIRGDFAQAPLPGETIKNIVHGSDSLESAQREINLWLK